MPTRSTDLPQDYIEHAEALEALRHALLENHDSGAPIDYQIALAAWNALGFAFAEWQRIEALASNRIDELRNKLDLQLFEQVGPGGTA